MNTKTTVISQEALDAQSRSMKKDPRENIPQIFFHFHPIQKIATTAPL